MNPDKISWTSREIALAVLFCLAVASLLHQVCGGLDKLVAATDRPAKVFEDFQNYYYPASQFIFKNSQPLGGYFYTPVFAIFLHYLMWSGLDPLLFWQVLQIAWVILLLLPGYYLAGLAGRKSFLYWYLAAVLLSFPVYHNFKWGQVSVLIAVLTIFSLIAADKGRKFLAGSVLALAALIKYYPAFLLAGFLLKKDYRPVAGFVVTGLVIGLVLPGLLLGFATTTEFYRLSLAEMDYAIDWVAADANSQYFAHVVLRLAGLGNDMKGPVSLVGLILTAVVLLRIFLRVHHSEASFWPDMAKLLLLMPMLINTSWPHYFVWLPFCGLLAISLAPHHWLRLLSIAALLLQSAACFLVFPGWQEYAFSGILLFANLLILAHLLLLPEEVLPEVSA
ncbi:MAG: glycosyltransferase family 87 protein [Candidatus Rifleibacteriota bacterium]